jgi:hypothetical protein
VRHGKRGMILGKVEKMQEWTEPAGDSFATANPHEWKQLKEEEEEEDPS